jgi:uncharacterized membrane protein YgdD (TMEM256/DUF423 family)
MKNNLYKIAALGAIGVVFGALGAHSLKPHLTDVQLNSYETGIRYLFIHTLAMLSVALLHQHYKIQAFKWAFHLFFLGIVLFTGSIWILSTRQLTGLDVLTPIAGPITPIGGLVLVAAWLMLGVGASKINNKHD